MSVAIRAITRLQDADDAPALGAGQNGYALTWDNDTGAFVAQDLVPVPATKQTYTLEGVSTLREINPDTITLGQLANVVGTLAIDMQAMELLLSLYQFSDLFTRDDGALGNGWTGSTAAIVSNAAVVTPAVGSDLATNGGMEDPYNTSGTLSIANGWTNYSMVTGTDTASKDEVTVHGGSASQKLVTSAGFRGIVGNQVFKMTVNAWYEISAWVYVASGSARLIASTLVGGIHFRDITTTGEWVNVKLTGRATSKSFVLYCYSLAASTFYVDDITLKALTSSDFFALREGESAYSRVRAAVTVIPVTFAGVVACANADSNPTYAVVAYVDGSGKLIVDKLVAGVWSNVLAPTAISYVAGRTVELRHTALNTFQVYYNDIQIGTDLTISDASIVSNLYYGLFSTNGGNSLDSFLLLHE